VVSMRERGETRSLGARPRNRSVETGPVVFLELESERPLAGSARYNLHGVARVVLGRGPERRASIDGDVLDVQVPDAAISTGHAEITRDAGSWKLKDLRSRNGTLVDSRKIEEHVLEDGALIQLGGTFFTFHAARERSEPALLDSGALSPGPTGL